MCRQYLWIILGVFVLTGCASSPTGQRQLLMYDRGTMDSMGAQSFDEMKEKQKIAKDPAINDYVQCVAGAITSVVPEHYGYAPDGWEVVVFDSKEVNAFALPGSKIGVYTGLLNVAQTPDQLAAVLGHEVGHVLANHSNARLSVQQLAGVGLALGAVALSDNEHRDIILGGLGLGATVGVLLPYSRNQESEADEIGQQLMADAGFDPQQAIVLWHNMEQESKKTPPEFLSTHPAHGTRIQQLNAWLPATQQRYQQALASGHKPNCQRPE